MRSATWFLSVFFICSQILACNPVLVWYGHSPDRNRKVQLFERRGKQYVAIDRKKELRYDGVALDSLIFSPDSLHFAYAARKGALWTVVRDGIVGEFFDGIGQVVYSPDSLRLVFAALKGSLWHIVEGERTGPSFDALLSNSVIFSPDSRHLAYAVEHHGAVHVVVDSQAGPAFDAVTGIGFSPDSDRLAYIARQQDKYRLVDDGFVSSPYDAITEYIFSPNGVRLAFLAKQAQSWQAVTDGIPGPAFEAARGLIFSPDSNLLVYVGRKNGRDRVVCPQGEDRDYDSIDPHSLSFNSDGRHLAYQARRGEKVFVVLDGKEGPPFEKIDGPIFSPKGSHYGYVAWGKDHARVIVDSEKGPEFFWAGDLVFSPNGKRFAYLVREGGRMTVILNQTQRFSFDVVMEGTLMFSSDSRHWACLAGSVNTGLLHLYLDGMKQDRSFDWEELAAFLVRVPAPTLTPELGAQVIHDWVKADMKIILRQLNP